MQLTKKTINIIIIIKVWLYLFPDVKSRTSPSFFHLRTGVGCPFGGEHFKMASSPSATSVSLGTNRKSSRRSERNKTGLQQVSRFAEQC